MQEYKHWASKLVSGDKVIATIRHKNDGSKNIIGAVVVVVANYEHDKVITGVLGETNLTIAYNELKKYMENIPKRIFLHADFENNSTDNFNDFGDEDVLWSSIKIDSRDIEYILLSEAQKEIIRLKNKCNELIATLDDFGA